MIIKPLLREKCQTCGSFGKIIQEETYGCDCCKKDIDLIKPESDYLTLKVFFKNKATETLHFCSWKCCLKKTRTIKTDYFIDLPFLSSDYKGKGLRVNDFWKFFKKCK